MPDPCHEEVVRDYFGEEVSWIFVWQACYTRALLFPACLAGFVFFGRYIMPTWSSERVLQLGFAFVMVLWVTMFNALYKRYEQRVSQRWGMDRFMPPILVRNAYVPELQDSWQVLFVKIGGDLLAFTILGIVVSGIFLIERGRTSIVEAFGE